MSLSSSFEPDFGASIAHMHSQRMPQSIRAPAINTAYNPQSMQMSSPTGVHVCVEGVPFQYQLTDDDLMKVFSRYGCVSNITVMDDGGSAVVQFTLPGDAAKATSALDGKVLNGVHGALRVTLFPAVPSGRISQPVGAPNDYMKKFTCRFDIPLEIEREFYVSKRIIGQKGINMKRIVSSLPSLDSAKLRLRGRGSGFLEGPLKQESNESLHLCVSCKDGESYAIVIREVTALLEEVYAQYDCWCAERGFHRPLPKVLPRNHPDSHNSSYDNYSAPKSLYPPTWGNDWKPSGEYGQTPSPQSYSTHAGVSAVNTPPDIATPGRAGRCPLDAATIERLIEERNEARRVCNFKEADRLRDILRSYGIGLMDEPGARGKGTEVTTWRFGANRKITE